MVSRRSKSGARRPKPSTSLRERWVANCNKSNLCAQTIRNKNSTFELTTNPSNAQAFTRNYHGRYFRPAVLVHTGGCRIRFRGSATSALRMDVRRTKQAAAASVWETLGPLMTIMSSSVGRTENASVMIDKRNMPTFGDPRVLNSYNLAERFKSTPP